MTEAAIPRSRSVLAVGAAQLAGWASSGYLPAVTAALWLDSGVSLVALVALCVLRAEVSD